MVSALNGQMLDSCWCLGLVFVYQVYFLLVFIQDVFWDLVNPIGDCRWEHKVLCFLLTLWFDGPEYLLNIKFEPFFEHLISLIDASSLQFRKVDVFSLKHIHQPAWCCHNNIHTISELSNLLINWCTSI